MSTSDITKTAAPSPSVECCNCWADVWFNGRNPTVEALVATAIARGWKRIDTTVPGVFALLCPTCQVRQAHQD